MSSYFCGIPGATGARGPSGPPGQTGRTGDKGPPGDNGSTTTFGIFRPRPIYNFNGVPQHIDNHYNLWWYVGGGWNQVGRVIGPTGNQGGTGGTGNTGNQGQTGETGDKGPKGHCRYGNNANMVRILNNGTNSVQSIVLFPYLYVDNPNIAHTIKFSYKLQYSNEGSNTHSYYIRLIGSLGPVTTFEVTVRPGEVGIHSNLDIVAGLNSSYYYCEWSVSNPSLHLVLDNICIRSLY